MDSDISGGDTLGDNNTVDNNNTLDKKNPHTPLPISIFLASPGDLPHERIIAGKVIEAPLIAQRFDDLPAVAALSGRRPAPLQNHQRLPESL